MLKKGTRQIRAPRPRSQDSTIRRRSIRSAIRPPTGAAKIGGTRRITRTAATAVGLWVFSKASAIRASVATQSPSPETAWPIRRRRNPVARRRADGPGWLEEDIASRILGANAPGTWNRDTSLLREEAPVVRVV